MAILILGGSAGIPLQGHPDGFIDDNDHPREAYLDAAKAFGIFTGYEGGTKVKPSVIATRDTVATMLVRMYALPAPPAGVDYFSDDNGSGSEATHNKVGHAGLFTGVNDGNGGRAFKGANSSTKGQLATLAQRAKDAGLVPVWAPTIAPAPAPPAPEDDEALDDTMTVDDEEPAAPVDLDDTIDDPALDEEPGLETEGPADGALVDDHFAPPEQSLPDEPSVEGACTSAGASTSSLIATVALAFLLRRRRQ